VQRYSTLALADVYAVITYYLRHRSEVEAYLARREQQTEEVQQRTDSRQGDLSEAHPAPRPAAVGRMKHAGAGGRREF
jgi:hypothetical protein